MNEYIAPLYIVIYAPENKKGQYVSVLDEKDGMILIINEHLPATWVKSWTVVPTIRLNLNIK